MQDVQSIGGGGGRLFGGGGGGDRRLRPQHPQNHQALKCPRCDSLNTKFCYYNNYNLSQPRHFCKACRRYWTKGGVLRNVPVGGGCRKTKRSKPKQQQTTSAADNTTTTTTTTTTANITTTTTTPPPEDQQRGREKLKSSNSHSSSESSSLTAANTATANTAVEGHSSGTTPSTHNSSNFNTKNSDNIPNGIGESKLFSHASDLNPNLEVGLQLENGSSDCGIFSEIGGFTGLINSNNEQLQFGFSSLMNQMGQDQPWQPQNQKMGQHRMLGVNGDEIKLQEMGGAGGGLIDDQTVPVESSRFGALDWHGTSDHGLFDLHTAVDHAYWTSQSQWTDQDHPSLYLP